MDFSDWEPVYEAILADFGFDRAGDERARDELAALVTSPYRPDNARFTGQSVAVAGAAPTLESEADLARDADAVVAASTAADRLVAAGVDVDWVVTDLDKHGERVAAFIREGTPVAVHAHGDNRDLLAEHVPDCDVERLLPTTQAAPVDPVVNYGGFTDGDRAAFLADRLGAADLVFPGWDFEAATGPKARKLAWAERLLYWLERRRGERFAVLDGRRGAIDTAWLPVE
ncbi:6-hydroxymethylpterin diphosphokinase MptE-like protein [Halomicrobium salinisoli]|uniref:6-hydroxymethylpterin diphosphokinase MptE-like protein n=1 Tax=Halomicrobium salinisoli TaxID=2878391 RepID=UPI001CF060B7|nr:6-hydroxymethylpterin diphosphokinase MptE-like protein [Halomicrobium salinisoli]